MIHPSRLPLIAVGVLLPAVSSIGQIRLDPISRFGPGIEGGAEIVDFDPVSQRAFVVNAENSLIDVQDLSDPTAPAGAFSIDISPYGEPNSVAVKNGIVAVAAANSVSTQDPGSVVLFDTDGNWITTIPVGSLPDMLTFTPDGAKILVANEGEPNDDYTVDPEGSISIIDLSAGAAAPVVRTAEFRWLNFWRFLLERVGIRIFGPNATVAQDLEPEYIAVSPDGRTAYVACQENNAIAVVNIPRARVVTLLPLGVKNHEEIGRSMDASNRDDGINIQRWPVLGMYQPDAIALQVIDGQPYLFSANEGDARDYDGFSEEARVGDLQLAEYFEELYPGIQQDENLGRLNSTTAPPAGKVADGNGDPLYRLIHSYGARSFSIWDTRGRQVFDSGNEFEIITASQYPERFNSQDGDVGEFDDRSDDKGPEPEALAVGEINGRTYCFIGLERISGVMVYDVSLPENARFVEYVLDRRFVTDSSKNTITDVGPEGMKFVSAADSPSGVPLLLVANEVSGQTTVYEINSN